MSDVVTASVEDLLTTAPRFNRLRMSMRRVSTSFKELTNTIAAKTKLVMQRRDSNESNSSVSTAVDAVDGETRRSSDIVFCKTDLNAQQLHSSVLQTADISNKKTSKEVKLTNVDSHTSAAALPRLHQDVLPLMEMPYEDFALIYHMLFLANKLQVDDESDESDQESLRPHPKHVHALDNVDKSE
jgi:hypothetical protein